MGEFVENIKSFGAGTALVVASDAAFYRGFTRIPMLADKPLIGRVVLGAVGLFGMSAKNRVLRDAMLCLGTHNLGDAPIHLDKWHLFLEVDLHYGVHGIDAIASEAVAAIEESITDELKKLKESVSSTLSGDKVLSDKKHDKHAEAVEYEMVS